MLPPSVGMREAPLENKEKNIYHTILHYLVLTTLCFPLIFKGFLLLAHAGRSAWMKQSPQAGWGHSGEGGEKEALDKARARQPCRPLGMTMMRILKSE